jgi:hypothetical protein
MLSKAKGETDMQIIKLIVVSIIGLAALSATSVLAQAEEVFVNVDSSKCADVANSSVADGVPVVQRPCTFLNNQIWRRVTYPGPAYSFVVLHSGKCMDVTGEEAGDAVAVIQWPCNGQLNQRFRVNRIAPGRYQIIAVHSGKCLDIVGASRTDGAAIIQMPCNVSSARQLWHINTPP